MKAEEDRNEREETEKQGKISAMRDQALRVRGDASSENHHTAEIRNSADKRRADSQGHASEHVRRGSLDERAAGDIQNHGEEEDVHEEAT